MVPGILLDMHALEEVPTITDVRWDGLCVVLEEAVICKRCESYSRRLDELNTNFNLLWDWLIAEGYDPDQVLEEAADDAEEGYVIEITDKGSRRR